MEDQKTLIRELNREIMKNTELKAKIKHQDAIIKQLRSTLASLGVDVVTEVEVEDYIKPQKGRPRSIDESTRLRIKKLKKEGLSCREISKKEGVSLGMISSIINDI